MKGQFKFGKAEKLTNYHTINLLFQKKGVAIIKHPILMSYISLDKNTDSESDSFCQVLFSVGKKKFKNASDRQLLRRRMREAYRLEKSTLLSIAQEKNQRYAISFLYLSSEKTDYEHIHKQIKLLIHELVKRTERIS